MSRTSPINGDPKFLKLDAQINVMMARYGFARKPQEGSTSWIATVKCPTSLLTGKTLFKLTYYGADKPMRFGIRKDFADSQDTLRQIRNWPIEFAMPPQQHVKFVGFEAAADGPTTERVGKVLKAFGEALPEYQIPLNGDLDALDQEFDALGL